MPALLSPEEARARIIASCKDIEVMLLEKNAAYGNSVFDPIGIFSKTSPVEGISTRVDDKLQRLRAGHEYPGDDTLDDLIGYLVLLRIARKKKAELEQVSSKSSPYP